MFRLLFEKVKTCSASDRPREHSNLRYWFRRIREAVCWLCVHPSAVLWPERHFSMLEVEITTNCTLRCKDCAHFIPYYRHRSFFPADEIIADLEKLLASVRWIGTFRVLGGEPFLHPDLQRIVEFLLRCRKIGRVVVVTNATVAPSEGIRRIMANRRFFVSISDYGSLSTEIHTFKAIAYAQLEILAEANGWYDHGALTFCPGEPAAMRRQFSRCDIKRNILYNGKLFICIRCAIGPEFDVFSNPSDEYVDVRNGQVKGIRRQLRRVWSRRSLTACHYCASGTDRYVRIPVAEQLSPRGLPERTHSNGNGYDTYRNVRT